MTDPLSPFWHLAGCARALGARIQVNGRTAAARGWSALVVIVVAFCAVRSGSADAEPAPDFAQKAAALVERYARDGVFSGSVIVAERGLPAFRQAFGLADRGRSVANTPDTRFQIGSVSKQFTAVAVLKLVEAGRLDLDAPAMRYVPDLPGSWAPITLRMLLDHTSGLPNISALPDYPETLSRIEASPRAMVARLEKEDLLFPAGTAHEYSNTGYILLAEVIERVTGLRFSRYIEEAILTPLGLAGTVDGDPSRVLPLRASGYGHVAGEWRHAAPVSGSATAGAGGLVSTVDDLVAWDRALMSGAVVSTPSLEAMTRDAGHGYGLGLYLGSVHGHRMWSHGGFIRGFTAIKDTYPDLGLTIVVLANTDTAPVLTMARTLATLYFGDLDPTQQVRIPATVLSRYVGYYQVGSRTLAAVTQEGERLFLRLPGQPRLSLESESDRSFVASSTGTMRITFDVEPDGRATGALLSEQGRERAGPRIDADEVRRRTARLAPRDLTQKDTPRSTETSPIPAERQRR